MSYAKQEIALSVVDLAVAGATVQSDAGSFTYGDEIMFTKANLVIAGIRFYWPGGHGALSVKAALYDLHNTLLIASTTVNVSAAGVYDALFTTPQTLTRYLLYAISTWETSGSFAIEMTGASVSTKTDGVMTVAGGFNGKNLYPGYFRNQSVFSAGDAAPTSGDTTDLLGIVEPILV
jgi:hypothetical protein